MPPTRGSQARSLGPDTHTFVAGVQALQSELAARVRVPSDGKPPPDTDRVGHRWRNRSFSATLAGDCEPKLACSLGVGSHQFALQAVALLARHGRYVERISGAVTFSSVSLDPEIQASAAR
jgi:hypothetical protein